MKRHLNLLPWKLRCQMLLRQRIRQWAMGWAVLVALATTAYAKNWHGLLVAQGEVATWQRRVQSVRTIDENNERLRGQLAIIRERLVKYGHLESEQLGFQLLATVSQSTESISGHIQVQKLTFKQTRVQEAANESKPPAKSTAKAPPKFREVRTLSLMGVATNNLAVAQFVASLRDSGAFHTVDLKLSQGSKLATTDSRTYQVECSF